MAVAASSLISLAQLKAYLPDYSGGTVNDVVFETLIDSVSAMFDAYLDRRLAQTVYEAVYLDGVEGECLWLSAAPAVEVTSVKLDGVTLTEGTDHDYVLYAAEGKLRRTAGTWGKGPKLIELTYEAGYVVQGATPSTGETELPADLKLACMMQVAREWKKAQGSEWGMTARTSPDGSSVTRIETGLLKEVKDILDRYRVHSV